MGKANSRVTLLLSLGYLRRDLELREDLTKKRIPAIFTALF